MPIEPLAKAGLEATAEFAWKHRRSLTSVASELFRMVSAGRLRVLVFGAAGSGKSTIGKLLAGTLTDDELLKNYQDSFATERFSVAGTVFGRLLVAPGQQSRAHASDELRLMLRSGQIDGVINVTAYGYHSFPGRGAWTEDRAYEAGMTPAEFLRAYLPLRRQLEIGQLAQLADDLRLSPKKVWLLTVVSKADLWCDREQEVRDYYSSGSYSAVIGHIQHDKGARQFPHEMVTAALTWQNFRDGRHTLLAETVAGYDFARRQADLARFSLGLGQLLWVTT
jgi:energy-coupling factor transporter ATP-binding protein EcfA2